MVPVQVALMSEVARARAVVDGHAGEAGVAEAWLGFLRNLAAEKANQVWCHMWGGWSLGVVCITTEMGCSG